MSEVNKQLARDVIARAFSEGDFSGIDDAIAPDAVDHDPQSPFPDETGPEAFKKVVSMYRQAFPDLRLQVEAQYAEGDVVVSRWSSSGTQDGEMMGLPATGRHASVTGITIDRFQDGKIAETWTNWDTLGLLQQLGAIPEPQAAG